MKDEYCGAEFPGHCEYYFSGVCKINGSCSEKVFRPEPNESPSSPRTSGSLPASQADSAFEGTGSQLSPVLRPAVGAASESEPNDFSDGSEDDNETCDGCGRHGMDEGHCPLCCSNVFACGSEECDFCEHSAYCSSL